jgi:hypothetical protein
MKNKVCTKCGIKKLKNEFSKTHVSSDGFYPQCKKCVSDYHKKYYQQNRKKILEAVETHKENNREKVLADKKHEYNRHKDKYILNSNNWQKNNREKSNDIKYKHKVKKRKIDPAYRIVDNLRSRMRAVLKGNNKSQHSIELIGCSSKELESYLENQFTEGMTWENYGYYGWHIDHIKPCSSFDLTDPEQQKLCFHYSNLQPLWAKDNIKKSNKY